MGSSWRSFYGVCGREAGRAFSLLVLGDGGTIGGAICARTLLRPSGRRAPFLAQAFQKFAIRLEPLWSGEGCTLRVPPQMSGGQPLLTCFLIPLGTVPQRGCLRVAVPAKKLATGWRAYEGTPDIRELFWGGWRVDSPLFAAIRGIWMTALSAKLPSDAGGSPQRG